MTATIPRHNTDRKPGEFPFGTPSDHLDDVLVGTSPTSWNGRALLRDATFRLLRRWDDGAPVLVVQQLQADGDGLRDVTERPAIVGEIVLHRFDGDALDTMRAALRLLEEEDRAERLALGMLPESEAVE